MKYIILSIDDKRIGYKEKIRNALGPENEIPFQGVNGADPIAVSEAMAQFPEIFYDGQRPLFYNWDYHPKTGEIGVWLSNLLAWKMIQQMREPVLVLEDDAIPRYEVESKLDLLFEYLPEDFHLAPVYTPTDCIFIPHAASFIGIEENRILSRIYQTYCHVAVVYSPEGAHRLLWLASQSGILAPVDIFTMSAANQGIVNGYQFQNHDDLPFTYDWSSETTIHNTEHLQWQSPKN